MTAFPFKPDFTVFYPSKKFLILKILIYLHRTNIIKTHKEKYCDKITYSITQKHTSCIDMFKTSIRRHASILLFPFFTVFSGAEATAQTVSLPETCRYTGNTEACVMTPDDAMADTSHTADAPSADMKRWRTDAGRLMSPHTQVSEIIRDMPKHRHRISYTNSNTFYAYIGYGRIMSKLHMAEGVKGNPRNGLFWQFGYDWTSKLGIGAGMMYNGFRSTYEHNGYREKSEIFYLAPQIVLKTYVRRWIIDGKMGLGLFTYNYPTHETESSDDGFGYNLHFGAEYVLSRIIGISASIGLTKGNIRIHDEMGYFNMVTAISALNICVGVRAHI